MNSRLVPKMQLLSAPQGLQEDTSRFHPFGFPFLIRVGQLVVHCLDALDLGGPFSPFSLVRQRGYEVGDRARGEELVGAVVERLGGQRGGRVGG